MEARIPRTRAARPLPPRAASQAIGLAWAGLTSLGLAAPPPPPALAQLAQYAVNDDAGGEENRIDPAATRLDNGDLFVLWVDNTWGQLDILGRRFHPGLTPVDEPRLINDDATIYDQSSPALSMPAGGRFAAAWLDERRSPIGVFAQVLSAEDGSPVGGNIELTVDRSSGLRERPVVATDARGFSLVCWEEGTFGLRRIRAQLVGDAGQRVGAPFFAAPETADRPQRYPAIGALPDGRWLLAWEETVGTEFRVFHRILEADGTPREPPRQDHSESVLDLASSPNPTLLVRSQDALILWTDNREGTSDVWGLWVDSAGAAQGPATLMRANTDSARDANLRAALAPDGRFAITWFGIGADEETPRIRCFAADRSPISGDLSLSDPHAGAVARPGQAIALSDAGWALVWTDDRSLSQQVYLRRIMNDGNPSGETVQGWSVPASASQFLPDVALLPDGRAVVVWIDLRGGSPNLYGRLLDATGRPQGQSFPINAMPIALSYSGPTKAEAYWGNRPRVAASGIGTFVVTWTSTSGVSSQALLGQLYDADAQPIGNNFLITSPAGNFDPTSDPWPAMGADGRFAVAWRHVVIQGQQSNNEIYYQLFDPQGGRSGERRNPVDEMARNADQLLPSIAVSPYGEVVLGWVDWRSGEWEVYRQRVAWDGTPLEPANSRMSEGGPAYGPIVATNGSSVLTLWEDRWSTAGLIRGRLEILETKEGSPEVSATAEIVDIIVNDFDSPLGVKSPRAAMDSSGRFIVTWWDERNGLRRVWCRRYDAAGDPLGPPYEIPAGETASNRQYPSVAADLDRIQFVWADTRRARGWDVLGRRVDWAYNGEPVPIQLHTFETRSEPEGLRLRWEVPRSAAGAWLRLWREEADAGSGPLPSDRAALVTPDWLRDGGTGSFEVLDRTAPAGVPLSYYLESLEEGRSEFLGPLGAQWDPPPARGWSAGPLPFRESVELRPPFAAALRLEIWDVSGRRVRSLERATPSAAPLLWDGRDHWGRAVPSGIYFLRPAVAPAGVLPPGSRRGETLLRLVRIR